MALVSFTRPRENPVMTNTLRNIFSWPGMAVLASLNGVVRELTYGRSMSEDAAHSLATLPLLALLSVYLFVLQRVWPLRSRREALQMSGAWLALTLVFEFGLGRIEGKSWDDLLRDYNVFAGRSWLLVPAAILILPEAIRRYLLRERECQPIQNKAARSLS